MCFIFDSWSRVSFEFQHNVCGRSIYAEGTIDAAIFLFKKVLLLFPYLKILHPHFGFILILLHQCRSSPRLTKEYMTWSMSCEKETCDDKFLAVSCICSWGLKVCVLYRKFRLDQQDLEFDDNWDFICRSISDSLCWFLMFLVPTLQACLWSANPTSSWVKNRNNRFVRDLKPAYYGNWSIAVPLYIIFFHLLPIHVLTVRYHLPPTGG